MKTRLFPRLTRLATQSCLAALLLVGPRLAQAVCACDPDVSFTQKAEVTLPLGASANVDVNLGNTPANFVTAAYEQIYGSPPSAATVNAQVTNLTTLPYWRRVDTVNTFLNSAGSNKTKV